MREQGRRLGVSLLLSLLRRGEGRTAPFRHAVPEPGEKPLYLNLTFCRNLAYFA